MVGLRLFLPESWTSDPDRMARARIPVERRVALSKPEIAIEEIDRVIASGVHFGCVLADAGYGSSAPFRHALSERGLLRSEEHTSELQSLMRISYAVFCLKKKK